MNLRIVPVLAIASFLTACPSPPPKQQAGGTDAEGRAAGRAPALTVKGSDTMVILSQRVAELYMAKNPGKTVQVTGGGSGTGIAALINGTTSIANASRPMKASEKAQVLQRRGAPATEYPVALDGLAVYVHESSPVQALSVQQIAAIYKTEITNWKEVGGPDARIVIYGRENNSGTYSYFKEVVLEEEDFAPETQTLPGTAAVVNAVSKDRNSIGYGGIAYGSGIRAIAVKKDADAPAVLPTQENVVAGTYPLSRYLLMYTAGEAAGDAKAFLDFTLSDEGQKVAETVGYYPLPKKEAGTAPAIPSEDAAAGE